MSKTHFNFTAKWSFSSNHSFIHIHFRTHASVFSLRIFIFISIFIFIRRSLRFLLSPWYSVSWFFLSFLFFFNLSMTKMTVTISCAYMINADIRNTLQMQRTPKGSGRNGERTRTKWENNRDGKLEKEWEKKHLHDLPGSLLSIRLHIQDDTIQCEKVAIFLRKWMSVCVCGSVRMREWTSLYFRFRIYQRNRLYRISGQLWQYYFSRWR